MPQPAQSHPVKQDASPLWAVSRPITFVDKALQLNLVRWADTNPSPFSRRASGAALDWLHHEDVGTCSLRPPPNAGWSCRGHEQLTYGAGLRAASILFVMAPQLNLVR